MKKFIINSVGQVVDECILSRDDYMVGKKGSKYYWEKGYTMIETYTNITAEEVSSIMTLRIKALKSGISFMVQ